MTSDQRGDSPHAKERRFDELPQRRRRQLLIIAGIRSLASTRLERWTRVGYERGMRSRKGER
jgi:hypothetical protein